MHLIILRKKEEEKKCQLTSIAANLIRNRKKRIHLLGALLIRKIRVTKKQNNMRPTRNWQKQNRTKTELEFMLNIKDIYTRNCPSYGSASQTEGMTLQPAIRLEGCSIPGPPQI